MAVQASSADLSLVSTVWETLRELSLGVQVCWKIDLLSVWILRY